MHMQPAHASRAVRRRTIALVMLGSVGLMVLFHALIRPMDGYCALHSSMVGWEDTEYAPGYSESGFRRIHEGMSQSEVEQWVGRPLDVVGPEGGEPKEESWLYTRSPTSKDYRRRIVTFREGRVSHILSEYYFD